MTHVGIIPWPLLKLANLIGKLEVYRLHTLPSSSCSEVISEISKELCMRVRAQYRAYPMRIIRAASVRWNIHKIFHIGVVVWVLFISIYIICCLLEGMDQTHCAYVWRHLFRAPPSGAIRHWGAERHKEVPWSRLGATLCLVVNPSALDQSHPIPLTIDGLESSPYLPL